MTRALAYAVLLTAMAAFGFGVYQVAGLLRNDHRQVVRPSEASAPSLPGTMYVAQDGALYRFNGGKFTQITDGSGWSEPAASADGSELVAIRRTGNYSDLFLLSPSGRVLRQLTNHQSAQAESNHWAFFPRFSADGSRVFYSYDVKDPYNPYHVDLTIFSITVGSGAVEQWTNPNPYTGGDVNPVPLKAGALIYTKYSIDERSQVHSQVWIQARAGSDGVALTPAADDCASPAVSADEKSVAMICRRGGLQDGDVVIAQLNAAGFTIGAATTLVHGALAAVPVFAPDGRSIAFLAPVDTGRPFQLWTIATSPVSAHAQPRELTSNVGLDSSAAPAWTP